MARGSLFLFFILFIKFHSSYGLYKICKFPRMNSDICKSVEFGNSSVSCLTVTDSVECAMKLKEGNEVHFAVFSPEEAVLIATDTNSDLQVIGEIRQKFSVEEPSSVSMVAVMRKELSGKFNELKGKRYCHPGFSWNNRFSNHFLKYLEKKVVQPKEKSMYSAIEEEVNSINNFFSDSCRPGLWAQTVSLDRRLKKDYPGLCSLCDSPDKCENDLHARNAFEAALDCLTKSSGDVTYVPLQEVKQYFGLSGDKKNNAYDYVFLCQNQTTMSIQTSSPCIWGKQPWNLLVTNKKVTDQLKELMPDWLEVAPINNTNLWLKSLRSLVLGNDEMVYKFDRTQDPQLLSNYIDRGGVDNVAAPCCRKDVRWCTVSDIELEKCNWISKAASMQGFQPKISCQKEINEFSCIQRIAEGGVDVVSIYTEYGYLARNVYNLSTVVYEDNGNSEYFQTIAVIRKENDEIKSFNHLRGKRACFPQYNGLGWISFVNLAKINNILGRTCPEHYFGPSCIPGAFTSTNIVPGTKIKPSMCSICRNSNKPDDPCPPYDTMKEKNVKALQCLSSGADVAFVNSKALLSGGTDTFDERINPALFKILCKNGTIAEGLLVDDNCALSTGINAEMVGRATNTIAEKIDRTELFLELDRAFGVIGAGDGGGVVRMFEKFKGEKKVLFKETTIALVNSDEFDDQIKRYNDLLSNVTDTCKGAAEYTTLLSFKLMIIAICWNIIL